MVVGYSTVTTSLAETRELADAASQSIVYVVVLLSHASLTLLEGTLGTLTVLLAFAS